MQIIIRKSREFESKMRINNWQLCPNHNRNNDRDFFDVPYSKMQLESESYQISIKPNHESESESWIHNMTESKSKSEASIHIFPNPESK